jgi:sigma-B regulation protein RsbU (phosphoserine phosphatase)
MQASLLPQSVPQIAGWEFAACWLPAREVAGDFYDFITIDAAPGEASQLGLVVADVTDKGMPAALFMALSRTTLRASLGGTDIAANFQRANRLICGEATNGFFVTLAYTQINLQTGEVAYVNAGHNPPLICSCTSEDPTVIRQLIRTAIPLGIDPNALFPEGQVTLKPGCLMLLYTDGALDALNPTEDNFGIERLQSVLLAHRHSNAAAILVALEAAIQEFTGPTPPFDDITFILAKRLEADEQGSR